MHENGSEILFNLLVGIVVIFLIFISLVAISSYINNFSYELKTINHELNRSTGSKRRYWIRRKRKLWLSLLPFIKY